MAVIVKEGKELEETLQEILVENNLTKEDIYYRYTEKKSGLFNKNITYEVKVISKEDLLNYIKDYLEELLTNMGLEVNFETKLREDTLYIKIYSSNNPVLIGRNGNTLKALEYIVKQKVNNDFGIHPYINLDVENYREKNVKRLERLAKNLAKDVVRTKTEIHMDNMNAYDRRIVHNVLTNFKGVKTESEGEEPNRHIVIKPE
jgi:spoIIIJ-associated protein